MFVSHATVTKMVGKKTKVISDLSHIPAGTKKPRVSKIKSSVPGEKIPAKKFSKKKSRFNDGPVVSKAVAAPVGQSLTSVRVKLNFHLRL